MVIKRVTGLILAVVVLAMPASVFAQSERGSITGVVHDTTRSAIPGVSVKVIHTETNAETTVVSSESGAYSAANLAPGTYRIEASLQGFRSARIEGITLTAGATARADVLMNLGAIEESVTVVAQTTLMQTEDAKVSTNISNELIDQLPLVVGGAMRSVFDLVNTIPEAKGSGTNVVLGGGQGGAFGATLDGISVNTNRNADVVETAFLTPSVEAITEFSVETNGFKPEFGQAGGGMITFASKSGTNQFKGSLYNFLRNDALDEKGFFEQRKGVYRQNNYGGSIGGPVDLGRPLRRAQQDVLLCGVRRLQEQPGLQRDDAERADARDVRRRLLELGRQPGPAAGDLRSCDDAAEPERRRLHSRPVPGQPHSRQPVQQRRAELRCARAIGRRAESIGPRARHPWLRLATTSSHRAGRRWRRPTS